jgi:hypothetical protein
LNKKFEIIEKINNATIIHHTDKKSGVWATNGRKVIHRSGDDLWQPVAAFPFSFPRDLFAFSRPSARAMRSDKCNVYVNKFGYILGIRSGIVYRIEKEKSIPLFTIQGDCVLHRSINEDDDGNFYFGEYFMNPGRQPVNIWRVSSDLTQWQKMHEFNQIRHIHGIYRDLFSEQAYWVTVGDFKGECYLMKSDDCFRSFTHFGDGSQNWRAVNIFFTSGHVNWLTDSNLEINHACRMNRKNGELEIGQALDSSAWYGCTTIEGSHLAFTTIERGPAILSDESSVLISEDAFHWDKIFSFKKDPWKPVQVFKYGVISCPSGEMSIKSFYLSGEGLIGLDGVSIKAGIV